LSANAALWGHNSQFGDGQTPLVQTRPSQAHYERMKENVKDNFAAQGTNTFKQKY
jgi:hypothetical protein